MNISNPARVALASLILALAACGGSDTNYGAGPNAGNNHADDAPLTTLQSDTKFFGGNDKAFV